MPICRCWARRSKQTKSLDQDKIADYIRTHTFKTVVGDVAFGEKGEWKKARVLTVQFQNIAGTSVDDFRDGKGEVVLWPDEYKAGEPILPYSSVKHLEASFDDPARPRRGRFPRAAGSSAGRGARRSAAAAETICCRAAPVRGSARGG